MVQQDKGSGGDRADAPGAEADPAQCLEGGLEQRVAAFGRSAGGRVQQVDGVLVGGQRRVGGLLDRRGQRRPLAFIAQSARAACSSSVHAASSGSASGWARSMVVSCPRPGRTPEVHSGQPSGAARTCTVRRARRACPTTTGPPADSGGRPALLGLPALVDKGYHGAGIGVHTPAKGARLAPSTATRNRLLTRLRRRSERGIALLKTRWKALRHVRLCPQRIGAIAAAALVLTIAEGPIR
jgi:hypothetical protein